MSTAPSAYRAQNVLPFLGDRCAQFEKREKQSASSARDLAAVATFNLDFSTLVIALALARIAKTLRPVSPFTLVGPTTQAFVPLSSHHTNQLSRITMNRLPLPAPNRQACLQLKMPLHAYTDSDAHVAQLVGALLNDIAGVERDVSHSDMLQALAIAMADAAAKPGVGFSLELLDVKAGSANETAPCAA